MFEDSLIESQHRLASPNQSWITVGSLTLQCALAAALIAIPLLHPESLPFHINTPQPITLPPKPLPKPIPHVETTTKASSSSSAPSAPATGHPLIDIPHMPIGTAIPDAAPDTMSSGSMTGPNGIPSAIGNVPTGSGTHVALAPEQSKGPLHISTGVSLGLLQAPIRPIYPAIARNIRVEGTVVIEAIISKTGSVESVHATSGPRLLRNAAIDAIRAARYSPYLLNGSPTEVETTFTVNFKLGS